MNVIKVALDRIVLVERVRVCSAKGELTCFGVFQPETLPVEQLGKTFGTVTLVDTLTTRLLTELEHLICQLVDRVFDTLHATVDDVDTVILATLDGVFHETTETGQVGGDGWNTHDGAFSRSVSPWLVVGWEDAQVATTDELFVVQTQDWVVGVQELRMEDDFNTVAGAVEELNTTDLVENGIVAVVLHVVGDDGRKRVALERENTLLERNLVGIREQSSRVYHIAARLALVTSHLFEKTLTNTCLDLLDSVTKLLGHGLTLERLDGVRVGGSRHDDECNHSSLGTALLQLIVKTGKRLDKHVDTFVAVLVSTSGEKVECVFQIEIVVTVEVSLDELVDLGLGNGVQVLELVHGREFDYIETIGQDTVWLALEQMLGLVSGNVTDCSENVCAVSSSTLDAVTVIDTTLASLMIDIKVLQVVVEIDAAGTEVSTE